MSQGRSIEGWLLFHLSRRVTTLVSVGLTILITLLTTIASGTNSQAELQNVLDGQLPVLSVLLYGGVLLTFGSWGLLRILQSRETAERIRTGVMTKMLNSVPDFLKNAARDRIAFGTVFDVRHHPHMNKGWRLSEIDCRIEGEFKLPDTMKASYEDYKKRNFENKRLFDDGAKVTVARSPTAFTDSEHLLLECLTTLHSVCLFYQDWHDADKTRLTDSAAKAITPDLNAFLPFPGSLCVHCLVVTKDEWLLVIKRPPDVAWYANLWSPTVDENFSDDEIKGSPQGRILSCIVRGLNEELGISSPDHFDPEDIRVLSVLLEGSLPDIGLCAIVRLKLGFNELEQFLSKRKDIEFSDRRELRVSELSWETIHQLGDWVPLTEYALMMLMLHTERRIESVLPP